MDANRKRYLDTLYVSLSEKGVSEDSISKVKTIDLTDLAEYLVLPPDELNNIINELKRRDPDFDFEQLEFPEGKVEESNTSGYGSIVALYYFLNTLGVLIICIGGFLAVFSEQQSGNALYNLTASVVVGLSLFSTAAILRLLVDIAVSLKMSTHKSE